jgi:hypothetical protein
MSAGKHKDIAVPYELIEAIESFPLSREVEHCGIKFFVSPFEIYAQCPECHIEIKLRSFAAHYEIEDVFDAVFRWMNRPEALEVARPRQQALAEAESEEETEG